jgi:hypothetical protein
LTEKTEKKETEKEQIIGVYMIGLLAVLVAFKLSTKLPSDANSFIGLIIMLWAVYALCMVFAYANIPRIFTPRAKSTYERFANILKDLAQFFLLFSLGAFIIFFLWYASVAILFMLLLIGIAVPIALLGQVVWRHLKKT